jgi:hypothetical protein
LNNPLLYTDPSGEFWHIIAGGLIGGTINWVSHGCKFNGEGASYFGAGLIAGAAVAAAPNAYAYISAGLSATNSVIGQGFTNGWKNINPQQVLFDGIIGGFTSKIAGHYGEKLSKPIDNLFGKIESPILKNILASEMVGVPFGGLMGGLGALGDNDPTTNFWDGAWQGVKMGFATSAISGIGNAVQYSIDNKVNFFTGKSTLKGNYTVYQGIDPATNDTKYVGITKRNPQERWNEHLNSGTNKAGLRYQTIETGLTKIDARIMEQSLINQYGLGKNGGSLYNNINSISPRYWYKYGIK